MELYRAAKCRDPIVLACYNGMAVATLILIKLPARPARCHHRDGASSGRPRTATGRLYAVRQQRLLSIPRHRNHLQIGEVRADSDAQVEPQDDTEVPLSVIMTTAD